MQRTRYVGWWNKYAVGIAIASRLKRAGGFPMLIQLAFNFFWVKTVFHKFGQLSVSWVGAVAYCNDLRV
jgi:hypothetical protein